MKLKRKNLIRGNTILGFLFLVFLAGASAAPAAVFFSEPMDSDPGWTTEGDWAFGVPQGLGGEHGYPDPSSGYTGTNVYGYNLTGDYSTNLAGVYLTSTAIDCSFYTNVTLSFQRWLGIESPIYDHAVIQGSSNGTDWIDIWMNSERLDGGVWTNVTYDISAVADGQPAVYIRFGLSTTDTDWQFCGWNIDDIQLSGGETDEDSDGMPDWWEMQYYGGVTNANPTATASNGVNTVQDCYIAGLDPTNPQSAFLISDLSPLTSESILEWTGVSGRVYTIYWASNLLNGFQPLESNIAWTAVPYTDTNHPAEGQGFYKIDVELE